MRNPLLSIADSLKARASGNYAGAQWNRLQQDWLMARLSADQAMRFDIQTLRNRARDLVVNNASAAAIPRIFADNVVGKDGIVLEARIESSRGNQNERVNDAIEAAWCAWGEPGNCTADGRSSWLDVQRLVVENEAVDGEVLIRLVRGFDNPWGFALDVLDPDQLDNYYNVSATPTTNQVVMGVEQDSWGRPVVYHLWSSHPSEPRAKVRVPVPASEILHLYVQRRPRQSRAVTWFAPVVVDLKMLGAYREAELVAARTAAAKQGFITSTNEAGIADEPDASKGETSVRWNAAPGVMERLNVGENFVGWTPEHPTAAFDAFDKAIIRSIASAFGISYMSLSGDLTGTSYGSGRIGMLAERALYQALQQRQITRFDTAIYRAWLEMSMLAGALRLPSSDPSLYYDVEWHPRSFPWIDPLKDIGANEKEVAMGTQSLTNLAAEQGREFEDVMKQRQREIELAKQYNVPLILSTTPTQKGVVVDEGAPDTANPADEPLETPPAPAKPATRGPRLLAGGS